MGERCPVGMRGTTSPKPLGRPRFKRTERNRARDKETSRYLPDGRKLLGWRMNRRMTRRMDEAECRMHAHVPLFPLASTLIYIWSLVCAEHRSPQWLRNVEVVVTNVVKGDERENRIAKAGKVRHLLGNGLCKVLLTWL